MTKDEILAAIRRAGAELGRAPSRGELRRITGVSHYRVLAEFATLREAVRAAGLEPNPKGEKISTEDLLSDWKRVAEKLGRRPSRAEYVREGRYSAGAFVGRFGSWGNISTTEDTEKHRGSKSVHRGGAETRRRSKPDNHKGHEETQREGRSGDLVIGGSGDHPTTRKPRVSGAPGLGDLGWKWVDIGGRGGREARLSPTSHDIAVIGKANTDGRDRSFVGTVRSPVGSKTLPLVTRLN